MTNEKLFDQLLVDRNRLERLQRFIKELGEKLSHIDFDVEQNPTIKQDLIKLNELQVFATKLQKDFDRLQIFTSENFKKRHDYR